MTDQDFEVIPDPADISPSPVPVTGEIRVSGRVPVSAVPAEFGTYRTITLVGTEPRQQILPQDNSRVRAWILVSGTGPVWVGTEAQCAAVTAGNTAGGGAQLATAQTLPVQHREAVWLVPDGTHSATVVVAQERMRT